MFKGTQITLVPKKREQSESKAEKKVESTSILSTREFVEEVKDSAELFMLIGYETSEDVEIPAEVRPVLNEFEDVFPAELPKELPP